MSKPGADKVLVVDDDEQILALTARILRSAGYAVITRASSIGTSAAVLAEQPDVVLMDLNMPLLSGDSLAALVRRSSGSPPIVILHSGLEERTILKRMTQCGADGSIRKGLSLKEFLNQFKRIVDAARDPGKALGSAKVGLPLRAGKRSSIVE